MKTTTHSDAKKSAYKSSSLRWLLLVPFIIMLSLAATLYRHEHNKQAIEQPGSSTNSQTESNSKENNPATKNNLRAYVKAVGNDYQHSRLGGISNLKISVINTSNVVLDKVRVKLTYIKANGNVWDTRFEDFYQVKSSATVTHAIPDTKRGTSVQYSIVTIKCRELGL